MAVTQDVAHRLPEVAPDYDEIVRVIGLYADGLNDSDVSKLKEAFHEDAWIFCTMPPREDYPDGRYIGPIADEMAGWASYPHQDIVARILSVQQAGDVASVVLIFEGTERPEDDPDRSWLDIHNLLRRDGVWKITNKTATHWTMAGGVAS
jgi:ketosteroid isomerase-like protein